MYFDLLDTIVSFSRQYSGPGMMKILYYECKESFVVFYISLRLMVGPKKHTDATDLCPFFIVRCWVEINTILIAAVQCKATK